MKTSLSLTLVAAALALNTGLAQAQDDKGISPAVVQQLDLVNRLIALGDARKDPLLLAAAASIQKSLGTDSVTLPTQSTAPEAVLERAKALAAGKKDLLSVVEDVSATKSKGASWKIDAVTGRSTYRY